MIGIKDSETGKMAIITDGGNASETDPVYSHDKPDLALKSELPTIASLGAATAADLNEETQKRIETDFYLQDEIDEAKAIAIGRARAKVFTDTQEMIEWLSIAANSETLNIGDNLYIVDKNEPDYWWDGSAAQELTTEKVDLSDYYTQTQINLLLESKVNLTVFNTIINEVKTDINSKANDSQSVTPSTENITKFGTGAISQTISTWLLQVAQKINGIISAFANYLPLKRTEITAAFNFNDAVSPMRGIKGTTSYTLSNAPTGMTATTPFKINVDIVGNVGEQHIWIMGNDNIFGEARRYITSVSGKTFGTWRYFLWTTANAASTTLATSS